MSSVFKIKLERGWYGGFETVEDASDSPIFLRRENAEKAIRREVRTARDWLKHRPDGRWHKHLVKWEGASVVEFKLVEVKQ
jgi:hypothetical protein